MERADGEHSTRRQGRAIRERAQGAKAASLGQVLEDLDPALLDWADSFIFGTVWSRPGLEHDERMLVAIASLASLGHISQLRNYLHGALQDGMPEDKIHETLLMLCVYAGFPATLTALRCWKDALEAHHRQAA
jgi:4-carboxymuconolactone decarboxylase